VTTCVCKLSEFSASSKKSMALNFSVRNVLLPLSMEPGISACLRNQNSRSMNLTTNLIYAPNLRMNVAKPPLFHTPSWRAQGQLPLVILSVRATCSAHPMLLDLASLILVYLPVPVAARSKV